MEDNSFDSQAHDINHKVLDESEKIAFEGAFSNILTTEAVQSAQALKSEGLL
jgi:hypothetical protein